MKNIKQLMKFIRIPFFLLFIAFSSAMHSQTDLVNYKLNSTIDSVKETYITATGDLDKTPIKNEKNHDCIVVTEFNKKGFITSKTNYKLKQKIDWETKINLEEKERKRKKTDIDVNVVEENITERIVRAYKSKSRVLTQTHLFYDNNGKTKQTISKFTYDKKKVLIEKNKFGFDNTLDIKTQYKYGSSKEGPTLIDEYKPKKQERIRVALEENQIVYEIFKYGKFFEKTISLLNSQKQIIQEVISDSNNTVMSTRNYSYNEHGHKKEERIKNKDNEYHYYKYSYKYDMYSNWTKKIISEHGSPVLIVEREIEY